MLKILHKIKTLIYYLKYLPKLDEDIDTMKSRHDISDDVFSAFQQDRDSKSYLDIYDKVSPLVSCCVATYNRGNLLVERSLKSLLNQTYKNIEVIVIGDHCTDQTESLINNISDERLRFINLTERGSYPKQQDWRWMVAGTVPVNYALSIATGDFITHLDDDDEHMPDRISKLVKFIQDSRADFIWHPFWREYGKRGWQLIPAERFGKNELTSSSVFYHNWFKKIPWDINAYMYREPGDWNRFRKIMYLGATFKRYPEPLLRHYMERNQVKT